MQNTDAMLAFYRGLGLKVSENATACSVYIGNQMINFHRPATWQRETFALRAPAAKPPCGDLCSVWDGTPEALKAMLDRGVAKIIEGPVARQGGRQKPASSVYVRDPDGNLLEFMIYAEVTRNNSALLSRRVFSTETGFRHGFSLPAASFRAEKLSNFNAGFRKGTAGLTDSTLQELSVGRLSARRPQCKVYERV